MNLKVGIPVVVVALVGSLTACAETPDGETIGWDEASGRVGERLEVCGPVAGVYRDGDDLFINVGLDYPDPARFTIVVWDDPDADVDTTEKVIACATGEVQTFEEVPQIQVWDDDLWGAGTEQEWREEWERENYENSL